MTRHFLWTTVSASALTLALGAPAFAQDITQDATNNDAVSVPQTTTDIDVTGDLVGPLSFSTVSSVGATNSLDQTAINAGAVPPFEDDSGNPIDVGTLTQTAVNNDTAPVSVTSGIVEISGGDISGAAASAAINATGATNSASATVAGRGVDPATGATPTEVTLNGIDSVDQLSENNGAISNTGGRINADNAATPTPGVTLSGNASSASIGATGASALVSNTFVDSENAGTQTVGDVAGTFNGFGIEQFVENRASASVSTTDAGITAGGISGAAASASISATGSAASVSTASIDTTTSGVSNFGSAGISQTATTNIGVTVEVDESRVTAGVVSGPSASAGISGTGAVARVSERTINVDDAGTRSNSFGNIDQDTTNAGSVDVSTTIGTAVTVGGLLGGAGSSASISGAGATSAVSSAAVTGDINGGTFGTIDSDSINNEAVTVGGAAGGTTVTVGPAIGIDATAARANVSASGATTSVSEVSVGATRDGGTFGAITQSSDNNAEVRNQTATVTVQGSGIGALGTAANAGISAAGAASAVSSSAIGLGTDHQVGDFADITQISDSSAATSVTGGTVTIAGVIAGTAASATIGASGASTSVSVGAFDAEIGTSAAMGAINQTANNTADVSVSASNVAVAGIVNDQILGDGASAAISASGASNGVSFSFVQATLATGAAFATGPIAQDADNTAAISIQDSSVTSGDLEGVASNAATSVRGASNSVSVSSINGTPNDATFATGAVTQDALNTDTGVITLGTAAPVSVSVGAITGNAAIASASVTGASNSVSVATISQAALSGFAVTPATGTVSVAQVATNNAAVTNAATITVGGDISGVAAGASVTAVGASNSVSISAIN